jgi:hypothetical protein
MPRKRRSSKGSKAVASLVSNEPLDSLERDAVSTFFAGKSLFLTGATGFLGKVRAPRRFVAECPQQFGATSLSAPCRPLLLARSIRGAAQACRAGAHSLLPPTLAAGHD